MKFKIVLATTFFFIALMFILSALTACDDSASVNAAPSDTSTANDSIAISAQRTSSQSSMQNKSENSSEPEQQVSSASNDANTLGITSAEAADTPSHFSQKNYSSSTADISSVAGCETHSSSSSATAASGITSDSKTEPQTTSSASGHTQTPLDKDGFATVADVYNNLAPSEKAVFVIRHSEREDAVTIETELTANGIQMAKDLGATLKSDEEFSYITSGFVRTNETANHIAAGRGTPNPKLITNYDITGNWFLKISADELATYATNLGMQGNSIELMSHWAYGEDYPDAFYELDSRAKEFMETVILKNLPKWNRVSIMVSHDIFVMPLAVYGSQRKVALKYYEDYHWINYIAGLAIIVSENNELRYIPVKGADSGVIDYLAIYMAEHNLKY